MSGTAPRRPGPPPRAAGRAPAHVPAGTGSSLMTTHPLPGSL